MAKVIYNNIKNTSTRYLLYKLNYRYYLYIFYKNNINFYSKSKLVNKLAINIKNLIIIYKKKSFL